MNSFNRNLILVIVALWIVIAAKLYLTALATDNMRGFAYSMLHVIIVSIGTYFAIRKCSVNEGESTHDSNSAH